MLLKKPNYHWPLGIYRVSGHSMLPTYRPGDTVLGWRRPGQLPIGSVVVASQDGSLIIKRLTAHAPDGALILAGDNPADSRDSRQFGALPRARIVAQIILKLP